MIKTIKVDSTWHTTDLCKIGSSYNTDKAPYSLNSVCSQARKGYTAVYELIFSSLRHKEINFCEIGIEACASLKMWEEYFTKANIFAFEYYDHKIDICKTQTTRTTILKTDVTNAVTLDQTFASTNLLFDIIIDDSTHHDIDQINIINVASKYLKSGGILIIEDIMRNEPESRLDNASLENFNFSTYIICDHENRSGHDNDKIWYGVKE